MNFSSDQAVYLQIKQYVKENIAQNSWLPGERIPSVRELSVKLEVNPSTVQRAYRELEDERLFETKRGIGSFITENMEIIDKMVQDMASGIVEEFFKGMAAIGYDDRTSIEYLNKWIRL